MRGWCAIFAVVFMAGEGTASPCSSANLVHSDNFNSAAALSDTYTVTGSVTKTAGIGPDASQAIRTTSWLGGELDLESGISPTGRHFCVSIDSKPTYANNFGIYILELRHNSAVIVSLYIGGGDFSSNTRVTLYNRYGDEEPSATGVIDLANWQTIKMRGEGSSAPGVADGWVKVFIDGTLVLDIANWRMSSLTSGEWNQFSTIPSGDADNLCLALTCDEGVPSPEPGELMGTTPDPCCGEGGTSTGPILPAVDSSWEPACAGGGTVPTAADLTDAENWDDATPPLTPDEWFEMVLEPYPTDTATTYRWAGRPFADAGSWKEGRLVARGPIDRALSDDDGHYEIGSCTVTLDDQDGVLRGLLAANSTQYFTGREAGIYLLSEAGRRAGTAPRTLFRGRVSDVQILPGRQVAIDVRDLVGSAFSGFDLDKTIGIPVGTEHTALPEDSIGRIYPIIYGEHSDRGAVDANGDAAEKGMLPVIDTGDYHPFGEDIPTTYVSPPTNVTAVKVGSGSGSRTYYYGITAVTSFGETVLSAVVSVSGLPDSLDDATYVEIEWDPPATGSSYVIAYRVYGRTANPPNKWLDLMNNGGTFASPEQIYRDGRQGSRTDFDREKSPGPPKTSTALIEGTNMAWGRLLVGLGAIDVRQVFGSDLADQAAPKRVELDIDGSDVCTSRSGAWPHPDPYIEVGGIRQTVIYMRGPRLHAHRDGSVSIAVNACGYEDVGDGSGTLINQAFFQYQHFINEHILKDEGIGYRTGTWGPLETYANGNAQIKTSSFAAAQTLSIARIGGLGYLGAFTIHEPTTVREIVRRLNISFDCFLGANHHGQSLIALIDERATPTAGRHYRDRIDMVALEDQRFDHDAIETKITYDYDWDPDSQAFRAVDRIVEDTTAADALKGVRHGAKQELYATRDLATAYDSRLRRLFRHRRAPRYVSVRTNYLGLEDDLSDQIRLTHYDGLGASGDVNTPGFVRKHRIDRGTTTLEMLDLRRMGTLIVAGGAAGGPADGGVPSVVLTVPAVTAQSAAVVLAAGRLSMTLEPPTADILIEGALLAGRNQLALAAPSITATGGAISRTLGSVSLTLKAPTAIAYGDLVALECAFGAATGFDPADATTYHFGSRHLLGPATSADPLVVIVPKAGTVLAAYGSCVVSGTLGSSGSSTFTVANLTQATSETISSAVALSAASNDFSKTGMALAVAAGDELEITWLTPTWVTEPTDVFGRVYLLVALN